MCLSQRSRKASTVTLLGSTYEPLLISVTSAAHFSCASRLPLHPGSECHLRLRFPVAESRRSTIAYHLPLPRSLTCPFIALPFRDSGNGFCTFRNRRSKCYGGTR